MSGAASELGLTALPFSSMEQFTNYKTHTAHLDGCKAAFILLSLSEIHIN